MKSRKLIYTSMFFLVVTIGVFAAMTASAKPVPTGNKGKWVAVSADNYDHGYISQSSEVTMVLRNASGQEARRELRITTLEVKNDGDKSITVFDEPRDIKGTSLLTYTHARGPDDQWLYLPSLRRVKRISSANKSGPFVGSEFAYEDLVSQEIDKYTYKYIKAEKVLGVNGHLIERIPVDRNSGYTRQRVWIDGTHWRTVKVVYYDRKNTLLKTLTYHGYRKYSNNKWRPAKLVMKNHQTGKSTTLHLRNFRFNINVSAADFDRSALRRSR